MGHEIKRVPADFNHPIGEVWPGYLTPESLREQQCATCDGSGGSPYARQLKNLWYGYARFDPLQTNSQRLYAHTPVVRQFAERNIRRAPDYYGTGEQAIIREALRLARLWNGQWCHHLDQNDVDALIADGRLYDFTHTWIEGEGWRPTEPPPAVTAAQVNEWSLNGFGHDSINMWVVVKARCIRDGEPDKCANCNGHGATETYPGQRAEAEAWQPTEPPTGEAWQLWETRMGTHPDRHASYRDRFRCRVHRNP